MKQLITLFGFLFLSGNLLQLIHSQEDWEMCLEGSDLFEPPECPIPFTVHFPFPYDCRQYYKCCDNVAICLRCAPGTIWDQTLASCMPESETPCVIVTTPGTPPTTPTTTPTTTTTDDPTDPIYWVCPEGYDGLVRHPWDCRYFYSCHPFSRPCIWKCPFDLYYNPVTEACDWPQNVPDCFNGDPPPSSTTKVCLDGTSMSHINVDQFSFPKRVKSLAREMGKRFYQEEDQCDMIRQYGKVD